MKLKFTIPVIRKFVTVAAGALFVFAVQAQDYSFTGGVLKSGTALQAGAVYSFSNVKSGVDATVTITNITGGITVTSIDGGGGFAKALQPVLSVPGGANGYLEMLVNFYDAGSTTPMSQAEVPVTPIDVDGGTSSGTYLYEFDEIEMINGYTYFQYAGSELNMSMVSGWARGKNTTGVDYPGIDTVQKSVMFTSINANISSFRIRVGADNQTSGSASRLRSLYFQRFTYPFTLVLPNRTLLNFSGAEKNNGVELKGTLSASHTFDKMYIERGNTSNNFETIAEINITGTATSAYSFTYFDSHPDIKMNFYRIRLVNTTQNLIEISNTLMVKMNGTEPGGLQVLNTMVKQNDPVVAIQSRQDIKSTLQLYDMSGRMVYQRGAKINTGTNSIDLSGLKAMRGYYVLTVSSDVMTTKQKIVIQ